MSDEIKDLKKKLLSSRKNGYDRLSQEQLEAMETYCASYKTFLDASKTGSLWSMARRLRLRTLMRPVWISSPIPSMRTVSWPC